MELVIKDLDITHLVKTDLDLMQIWIKLCGSYFFLPWDFTKELQENDNEMVFCTYNSFVKLSLYNTIHF